MPMHGPEPQQALGGGTLCVSPLQELHTGVLLPLLRAQGIPQPIENSPPFNLPLPWHLFCLWAELHSAPG